jgi:hypothetical protein
MREFAQILGKSTATGESAPYENEAGALPVVLRGESTASRVPLTGSVVVTDGAAVQLSTATPDGAEESPAAWVVIVPAGGAAVRIGGSGVTTSTGITVPAGGERTLPSSTLAGWYAIAESGSVTVELLGAEGA